MNSSKEMAMIAASAADDRKARDIVVLDLQGITLIADYFVVCSGTSSTQVQAVAKNVEEMMHQSNFNLLRREGYQDARWVLLDYGAIVVHIFQEETRRFYELERLWGDARIVERVENN
ncbi:MAG: ribosome silencing factor [Bacillota bacterium]